MVTDAKRALDSWSPDQNKVRRTLTSANRGRNPLISHRRPSDVDKELPEIPAPSRSEDMLAAPNPVASLSTPTSQRDRARHRTTSLTNANNQGYDSRQSHRLSSPNPGDVYDPYKPDDYGSTSPWDYHSPSPTSRVPSPSYPPGSHYLTPPDYQQYYQFYEQYTPPQPWEEAAGQLIRSPAVFHPTSHQMETRRDAGGFVLPGSVPSEHEYEFRSPTPTSNPLTSELNVAVKQQRDQKETASKEDEKQTADHMPGDFPNDNATKPSASETKIDKPTKPLSSHTKPETSKVSTGNTGSGGPKVSALLAKFQNLGNK
jgi:hypothetical protein